MARSRHGAGRFASSTFVANVVELLDRLALEQAVFFGYSMGGYVALCLGLEHPDRVDRVTTLGTKFRWDPAHAAREVARLDPSIIQSKVPSFAATLEARHVRAGGWQGVLAGTAELLGHLGDHPLLTDSTLPGIAAPVRVVVGDRDNTVSVDESSAVARFARVRQPNGSPGHASPDRAGRCRRAGAAVDGVPRLTTRSAVLC
jgi:pimeloyl-ACP methyl ester carboxylesterase